MDYTFFNDSLQSRFSGFSFVLGFEYYTTSNENYDTMASSFVSTRPDTNSEHDFESKLLSGASSAKVARRFGRHGRRGSISSSTSQLSDSSYSEVKRGRKTINQKSHELRKGMSNLIEIKDSNGENSKPLSFWRGIYSKRSRLSLSALSLTSTSKKKNKSDTDESHLSKSRKSLRPESKTKVNLVGFKGDQGPHDLSRSQSCQAIPRRTKDKKKFHSRPLSNHCNDSSGMEANSNQFVRNSNNSLNSEVTCNSVDNILNSIPHMDSSSSDDEDFRRRSLRTRVVTSRPTSSGSQLCAIFHESPYAAAPEFSLQDSDRKPPRPLSLIEDRDKSFEENFEVDDHTKVLEEKGVLFEDQSESSDRFKSDTMKKLHFYRGVSVTDVRASVRLRAKAIKRKARAFTSIVNNSKHSKYSCKTSGVVDQTIAHCPTSTDKENEEEHCKKTDFCFVEVLQSSPSSIRCQDFHTDLTPSCHAYYDHHENLKALHGTSPEKFATVSENLSSLKAQSTQRKTEGGKCSDKSTLTNGELISTSESRTNLSSSVDEIINDCSGYLKTVEEQVVASVKECNSNQKCSESSLYEDCGENRSSTCEEEDLAFFFPFNCLWDEKEMSSASGKYTNLIIIRKLFKINSYMFEMFIAFCKLNYFILYIDIHPYNQLPRNNLN